MTAGAAPVSLDDWLAYVGRLHHRAIDLGLERVHAVAARLGLNTASLPGARRIVVGGTNGKGSTCALLEAILRAAGYRVGCYGSPHLLRFNERARVDGQPATDAQLLPHFAAVERARAAAAISLTYFEFTTLVALAWFAAERVEVSVLEVGLGGRLDAVNLVDADCAVLTTVDLDHMDLLGPTREHIGREKAHIFRGGRPAIVVDPAPPAAVLAHAQAIGAQLWRYGQEFSLSLPELATAAETTGRRQWDYHGQGAVGRTDRLALPWPALRGKHQLRNAAGALAALDALAPVLPVDQGAVRLGLSTVQLPGRFQVVPGQPVLILDVAHNPHAARALAEALRDHALSLPQGSTGRTHAVCGMLRDKDAGGVVRALAASVDFWHLVPTAGERGRSARALEAAGFAAADPVAAADPALAQAQRAPRQQHASVAAALDALLGAAATRASSLPLATPAAAPGPGDRIVIFGSFVIVAEALRWLERGLR